MANWIEKLDQQLAVLLADWGLVTTVLALAIAAWVIYPIIYPDEPDTHPLLLARQSAASPVRNKNESSVYRSPEVPFGYPLRTGLNVKAVDAPRWAAGKDGDIRDVWREVQKGGLPGVDGKEIPKGSILTIMGREELIEHGIEDTSKEISIIGKHLRDAGVKKVAVYLPNTVEYLSAIFACAFYGLTPVLLPYNRPHPQVYELVIATGADALISAAGSLPLDNVARECHSLRLLTWVVEKTSRHMDWNGVPDFAQDQLKVSVWHDVVEDSQSTATAELPQNEEGEQPGDLISVWLPSDLPGKAEIVTFSQRNIVAATAALVSALPSVQRFTGADLILPTDSFTHTYVLCQTFAALFAHASLAINSVAGPGVDLALTARSVSPTVLIASAETVAALHTKKTTTTVSVPQKIVKYSDTQTLASGRMPTDSFLSKFLGPSSSAVGNSPGKLRLILVSERLGASDPPLTSDILSDLRVFTRARICYALTTAKVAGAVAQTNVFDYRRQDGRRRSHFGIPLSSVEVKLVNDDDSKVGAANPHGNLVVSGPAVSGGEVRLPVQAKFEEDCTLTLL